MSERKRVLYAVLVCALIALIASAVGIYLLYSAAFESASGQLQATVKSQARLVEAMARHDVERGASVRPGEIPGETLIEVMDSFGQYEGIGQTGEFLLGRLEGDSMSFLAKQRPDRQAQPHPKSVPFRGAAAEPMRRALTGQSGAMIARDYRGVEVLAAYEAVQGWNLGVVAKIDLAEVRAPYQRAAAIATALAVLTVLLCAFLILRVTSPLIRRLQASESRVRAIVDSAADAIISISDKGIVESFNLAAERIFGYTAEEVIGRNVKMLMPEPFHSEHDSYLKNYHATGQPKVIGKGCSVTARRKDGSVFHVDLIVSEMRLDGVRKFVGMVRDTTERVKAQEALRESEANLAKAQEIAHIGSWSLDLRSNKVTWSDEFYRIFGLKPGEREPSFELFMEYVHPQDRDRLRRDLAETSRTGQPESFTFRIRRADGAERVLLRQGQVFTNEAGKVVRVFGVTQDVTESMSSSAEKQKLSLALEQTADAVTITNRNGIIEYVNPAFEATTGYRRDEALGRKPSLLKSGKQGPDFYKKLWTTILAGKVFSEVFVNRRKDGSLYYEEKTITPLRDAQGNITHFVATGKDISERMQAQERLQFMAQHDVLTELPNRALFLDRLKQALARARMHRRLVAILFLDLDRFKNINDTLGHQIGDLLLQEIARRFSKAIRDADTVARLSGDEFGFLLEDSTSEKDISYIAEKILDSLKPVFVIDGHELFVSASIGISLYPNDGEESVTLLRNADVAMYRAKDMGKNNCQFYSADMSLMAFERLSLESSLRRAVDREEFLLYYQPQVDVQTGKILGVEALLRWQHPDLGLVPPNDFIALLEENGLIIPVGEWVLRKACAQVREWQKAGWEHLSLAVNLSARQFNAPGLVEMVERTTSELGFERERLELEITESVIMRHAQATLDELEALSRMGIQLAVDDFGTGYSSLSYLRRFPIDTLKIDSSFIRDIPHDPDDSAITTAIIVMAQSLKLKVIAEGVETQEQLDYLRASGCHAMQGYLFSKPLPPEELTILLSK